MFERGFLKLEERGEVLPELSHFFRGLFSGLSSWEFCWGERSDQSQLVGCPYHSELTILSTLLKDFFAFAPIRFPSRNLSS